MPQIDDMKAELMDKAEMADAVTDEGYNAASPSGKYSLRALNTLVDSLNMVLPLFQVEPYPAFTEVPTSLPGEFVKLLSMVADAAEEAEEDTITVSDMTDDAALNMGSGILRVLAKSKDFKRFLAQPEAKGEVEEAIPAKPVAPVSKPKSNPQENMDLFASRMMK
mgnify:CR=1 FL=1|tara:strand:+ start:2241 stop:2735 length:495 start_codon:yes stop_codon:yes gene_type:complete